MKELKFRDLRADEIELRVGATTETGFSLLLYKTARVDANILDETVGAYNWQKKFYQVKNTMICSTGIYFEDRKEWVWKDDAGDESNTEAIKGEASDATKRSAFIWGIGRKLYNSPFIWINKSQSENPKTSRYEVKHIAFDEKGVSELVIINEKTKEVVYSYPKGTKVAQNGEKEPKQANVDYKQELKNFYNTLADGQKARVNDWLTEHLGVNDIEKLSDSQIKAVCKAWGVVKE